MNEKEEKELRSKILKAIRLGMELSIENAKNPTSKLKTEYIICEEVYNTLFRKDVNGGSKLIHSSR